IPTEPTFSVIVQVPTDPATAGVMGETVTCPNRVESGVGIAAKDGPRRVANQSHRAGPYMDSAAAFWSAAAPAADAGAPPLSTWWRTIRTGHDALWRTSIAVEPNRKFERRLRAWVPRTRRVAWKSPVARTISVAGSPVRSISSQVSPSPN